MKSKVVIDHSKLLEKGNALSTDEVLKSDWVSRPRGKSKYGRVHASHRRIGCTIAGTVITTAFEENDEPRFVVWHCTGDAFGRSVDDHGLIASAVIDCFVNFKLSPFPEIFRHWRERGTGDDLRRHQARLLITHAGDGSVRARVHGVDPALDELLQKLKTVKERTYNGR